MPHWNLALLLLNELFHSPDTGTSREWLQGMPASFLQCCGAALQWCAPSHWERFSDDPEICISNQPPRHIPSVSTSPPHMHCSRESHSQELWIINHNNSFSISSQGRGRISTSLAYCISVTPLWRDSLTMEASVCSSQIPPNAEAHCAGLAGPWHPHHLPAKGSLLFFYNRAHMMEDTLSRSCSVCHSSKDIHSAGQ